MTHASTLDRRALRLLVATLAVYTVLVATHRGEFWPFSIYPMFSQAGKPWVRTMVCELPAIDSAINWSERSFDEIPGQAFALEGKQIDNINLANFVHKTKVWDASAEEGLRRMFSPYDKQAALMVLSVKGSIDDDGSVQLKAMPVAVIYQNRIEINPELKALSPSSQQL